LDDAFQHRKIKAGLSVLLTAYSNLYADDAVLPLGRLREWKRGSRRADVVVVTKCPETGVDFSGIKSRLRLCEGQELYFSMFEYDDILPVFEDAVSEKYTLERIKKTQAHILLVTGIVSPAHIAGYLKKHTANVESLSFPDHYNFRTKDFDRIKNRFKGMQHAVKLILTTEKDASRLLSDDSFPCELKPYVYALPVRVKIMKNKEIMFTEKIENYVRTNQTNG
jgi:tetraacyldisaccharide 4'-kinase